MKVVASSGVGGAWIDKKVLRSGDRIKLVSEAKETPSQQGGVQLVAKALVSGGEKEPKNLAINKPSMAAIIEVYGDETADWINKVFTAHVEKTMVSGKRGIGLYLVPEGYEVTEDSEGYVKVMRIGATEQVDEPVVNIGEEIDPADIPF